MQRLATKLDSVASQAGLEHGLYCRILAPGRQITEAASELDATNELKRSELLMIGRSYIFEFADPQAEAIFAETGVGFDPSGKITSVSRVSRIGSAMDSKDVSCKNEPR